MSLVLKSIFSPGFVPLFFFLGGSTVRCVWYSHSVTRVPLGQNLPREVFFPRWYPRGAGRGELQSHDCTVESAEPDSNLTHECCL